MTCRAARWAEGLLGPVIVAVPFPADVTRPWPLTWRTSTSLVAQLREAVACALPCESVTVTWELHSLSDGVERVHVRRQRDADRSLGWIRGRAAAAGDRCEGGDPEQGDDHE